MVNSELAIRSWAAAVGRLASATVLDPLAATRMASSSGADDFATSVRPCGGRSGGTGSGVDVFSFSALVTLHVLRGSGTVSARTKGRWEQGNGLVCGLDIVRGFRTAAAIRNAYFGYPTNMAAAV